MNIRQMVEVDAVDDEAPTEMTKRREIIKSAVDAAANGAMESIRAWRTEVDELEALVIQSGARSIESLNTHVSICEGAQIEVSRLSAVVAEMRKKIGDGESDV